MDSGVRSEGGVQIPWRFTILTLVGLVVVALLIWTGLHFLLYHPQTPIQATGVTTP
jgi:hypothetical protein